MSTIQLPQIGDIVSVSRIEDPNVDRKYRVIDQSKDGYYITSGDPTEVSLIKYQFHPGKWVVDQAEDLYNVVIFPRETVSDISSAQPVIFGLVPGRYESTADIFPEKSGSHVFSVVRDLPVSHVRRAGRSLWPFFVASGNYVPTAFMDAKAIALDDLSSHARVRTACTMWRGSGRALSTLAQTVGSTASRIGQLIRKGAGYRNVDVRRVAALLVRFASECLPEENAKYISTDKAAELIRIGSEENVTSLLFDQIGQDTLIKRLWESWIEAGSEGDIVKGRELLENVSLDYLRTLSSGKSATASIGPNDRLIFQAASRTIDAYRESGWPYTHVLKFFPRLKQTDIIRHEDVALANILLILRKPLFGKENAWRAEDYELDTLHRLNIDIAEDEFVAIMELRARRAFAAGIRERIEEVLRSTGRTFISRTDIKGRVGVYMTADQFANALPSANDMRSLILEVIKHSSDYCDRHTELSEILNRGKKFWVSVGHTDQPVLDCVVRVAHNCDTLHRAASLMGVRPSVVSYIYEIRGLLNRVEHDTICVGCHPSLRPQPVP